MFALSARDVVFPNLFWCPFFIGAQLQSYSLHSPIAAPDYRIQSRAEKNLGAAKSKCLNKKGEKSLIKQVKK